MFLLRLIDASALSTLSLPLHRRPATERQREAAIHEALRALQNTLQERKGFELEPMERRTAHAYLRVCAAADVSLTPEQLDHRLYEGAHEVYNNILSARATYAQYRMAMFVREESAKMLK